MTEQSSARDNLGAARLLIGLAQGVGLMLLSKASLAQTWPATDPWLILMLSLCLGYVVTTALVAVAQLRLTTLVGWLFGAVAIVVLVTWHAHARAASDQAADTVTLIPLLAPIFFVAYHMVAAADADRRIVAHYRSYFDIGWKNGVQLALSLTFVGAFWLLLYLGATLFELINVSVVRDIIERDWFAYPVTTTMFALAVHVTDVRVALINGIRNVSLVLLSWLLPVMTLLVVAFVATLPATGLAPLWATKQATPILLTAAGALVVLINAAYQDGEAEAHWLLRLAARIASLALAPLVALAVYSVWLRVAQYGLSPDRVIVIAALIVAACYAAGYVLAALWPGRWMKPLEATNLFAALIALVLAVATLTPIADPARLSVEDQLRRLRAGLIAPDKFDFDFLRFETARYGRDALAALARDQSSPRAQAIATKAEEALKRTHVAQKPVNEPPVKDLLATIVVRPGGGKLPESFINQDWPAFVDGPAACPMARERNKQCAAYMIDLDGDGAAEIVLDAVSRFAVYRLAPGGQWKSIGSFGKFQCSTDVSLVLERGQFQLVPPKYKSLEMNGMRLKLETCTE